MTVPVFDPGTTLVDPAAVRRPSGGGVDHWHLGDPCLKTRTPADWHLLFWLPVAIIFMLAWLEVVSP